MDQYKINDFINIIDDDLSSGELLQKIIKTGVDESFSVCNLSVLIEHHMHFKKAMPKVESYYAVKCNPDKQILTIFAAMGLSFDCASLGEIQTILNLGVDPKKIVFALPTKPLSHLRYATEKNVHLMSFDHECELEKIKKINPNAELLLRIRADAEKAMITFGKKFGCDAELDAPRILQIAFEMGLNVVGVCFNVGTSCMEPEAFYKGIAKSRAVFDLGKTIGFQMNIVDIGGGFPYENITSIDPIAKLVNAAIEDFFPAGKFENLRIIAEPGRYYVTPVLTIANQIHTVKSSVDKFNSPYFSYYISDGIYGSFLFVAMNKGSIAPYTLKGSNTEMYPCTIYGPTCDGTDLLISNYALPKLKMNDWIIFGNLGAYSTAAKTNFNGFSIAPCIYVCKQSTAKQFLEIESLKNLFVDRRNL